MGMLLNIEYPGMKNGTKMSHFGFELQNHRTIKIVQFGCCKGGLFRICYFEMECLLTNPRLEPTLSFFQPKLFWKQ